MRRLICLFLLVLTATPAAAAELCDANCLLDINFTAFPGGIGAPETLTFTFGNNGTINTGFMVESLMAGNTRIIDEGTALGFEAGGRFSLGDGGNLDFTRVEFIDAAGIELAAIGGSATITIAAGSELRLSGNTNLTIKSPITNAGLITLRDEASLTLLQPMTNAGVLSLQNNTRLVIVGTGCGAGCDVISPAGGALQLSNAGGAALVINNNGGTSAIVAVADQVVDLTDPGDTGGFNNPDNDSGSPGSSGSGAPDPWWLALALGLLALKFRRR